MEHSLQATEMNKYNIRAIRKELDDCVRSNKWSRFRSKLETLQSKPKLLEAVILAKSKLTNGSLLHALVKLPNTGDVSGSASALAIDLVISVATAAPVALQVQDSQQQTPLHIAVDRQQHPKMIQAFLEIIVASFDPAASGDDDNHQARQVTTHNNVLTMVDKHGDTPLIKAARGNASYHVISLLLQYDVRHSSALIENKRKQRTALYYIAANELQHATAYIGQGDGDDMPKDLKLVLLETYFTLQRNNKGRTVAQSVDDEWKHYCEAILNSPLETSTITNASSISCFGVAADALDVSLSLRALVACSHLLGKHAVHLLQFLLQRDRYRRFIVAPRDIDNEGNYLLHQVCMVDTTSLSGDAAVSAAATNTLLLEHLLDQEEDAATHTAIRHPNREGNLPIHLAIASQKEYYSALAAAYPDSLQHCNRHGELPLHIAMKLPAQTHTVSNRIRQTIIVLWKAQPDTVEVRDGTSRLHPFQLAACSEWGPLLVSSSANGGGEDVDESRTKFGADRTSNGSDAQWTNFIFSLLLAAPQALKVSHTLRKQSE